MASKKLDWYNPLTNAKEEFLDDVDKDTLSFKKKTWYLPRAFAFKIYRHEFHELAQILIFCLLISRIFLFFKIRGIKACSYSCKFV